MNIKAEWKITLECVCPHCCKTVDIFDDVCVYGRLEVGEHDTKRSRDIDVVCPKCRVDFTIDCEY